MSLYVVTHKNVSKQFPKNYFTIVVNANGNDIKGDYYDNIGDNISDKNFSYCELTAFYWIWKNLSTDKIVGIDHYRRFFMFHNSLLTEDKALRLLESNENRIILPKRDHFKRRMDFRYISTSGYKKDLKVLRDVIASLYPDYEETYIKFMHQYDMHSYNMFVANKKQFDNYCKWLFDILFEVERRITPSSDERKGYYKRVFGFMAERLLNVYVIHNKMEIIELPIKYTGTYPNGKERVKTRINKFKDKYM